MRLIGWLIFLAVLLLGGGGYWMWSEIQQSHAKHVQATPDKSITLLAPEVREKEVFISPANTLWADVLSDYERWITTQFEKNLAPGMAIAIVQDTSVLYLKGFGYRKTSSLDTVDVHTVFRLGSVSKSITGTLAARLVQQQLIQWDDPVNKYFDGFQLRSPVQTSQTTIRHLLSHTVGLPYHAFTDRVDVGAPIDTLIYHLRDLPLVGPAGNVYSYQNVAFSVLSKVFEQVAHAPFEVVLAKQLFQPLHMTDASATQQAIEANPNHALPHQYLFRKWRPQSISHTYYNVAPAGGVNASISDLAQWLRCLTSLQSDYLKAPIKEEMLAPFVRATARNRNFRKWKRPRKSYYGMGWRVLTFPNDTLYYHGGFVNGFRSEVAYYPTDRIGIAVLVNAPGAVADHALPEFFYRYEKWKEEGLKSRKAKAL